MKLDVAYSNSGHVPQSAEYPPRWNREAAAFRDAMGPLAERRSYGPGSRNHFDIFHPEGASQGTMVFVHGGYWLKFDCSTWSHFAKGALERGWTVAMPSYDLCPDVRIDQITQQVASAVETISWQTEGPITLAGHSAGGHLVARMGASDMLVADTAARVRQVVPISPVSDLRPLLQTSMNKDFGLDLASAEAESPCLHPAPPWEATAWVGAAELPAFVDQARWLANAWGCPCVEAPGKHHFDVIEDLLDRDSDLVALLTPDT